jgi:excinuclease ABC subunit C
MKNAEGTVIYVGKAKNLKTRIQQYFSPGRDERAMVPFLTAEVTHIDTLVVFNEKEALLLENTLIKKHQPKFNVLLKDDKTFIHLMINHKSPWPRIQLIRFKGKRSKDALYFGPYTNALAARHTFDLLAKLFPLRQCSDEELKRRKRPCLLYSIKRCIAPCIQKCTHDEYNTYVKGAINFLKGNDKTILKELQAAMKLASSNLEFEKAAALLQTIRQIEHVTAGRGVVTEAGQKNCDVFSLYRQGDTVMLAQLFFREGSLTGAEHYFFSHVAQTDTELLSSFSYSSINKSYTCQKKSSFHFLSLKHPCFPKSYPPTSSTPK